MEQGIEKGRQGKGDWIIKQLQKKFRQVPIKYLDKIAMLPTDKLDSIGEEIFDMENIADLESYFLK